MLENISKTFILKLKPLLIGMNIEFINVSNLDYTLNKIRFLLSKIS